MLAADRRYRAGKREVRRQAMLQAAHSLFVEKGFEATTLNDIVGRSGGSLATLYDLFENKPGLLRALVSDRCTNIDGALDEAISTGKPYREALRTIAEEMLDRLFSPYYVELSRVVIGQCVAHPELGQQIYDAGPAVCLANGAEYFQTQVGKGRLKVDDPTKMSEMFFQMVCGPFHTKLVFGLPVDLTVEDRARHLDYVLPAFLKVYELSD